MDTYLAKLPAKHLLDWRSRCLDDDEARVCSVIRRTERTVTVSINDEALADLISDARYYAEEMDPSNTGGPDYRPPARTLLRHLKDAGLYTGEVPA